MGLSGRAEQEKSLDSAGQLSLGSCVVANLYVTQPGQVLPCSIPGEIGNPGIPGIPGRPGMKSTLCISFCQNFTSQMLLP